MNAASTAPSAGSTAAGRTLRHPHADALARWAGHQRWLRYGLRYRLLRRWCDPANCGARSFEAPFAGYVYPGDLSRWIDWLVYFFGAYEEDELELLRDAVRSRPGAVALDVGANVGHHTLYLASFCAEVHAFEPYAEVARGIVEKIERNGLRHVRLHPLGLGDADVELPYFAPADHNVGNGTFVAEHAPHEGRADCTLQVRHGDRYLGELALPRIDLVKIDVEGFELQVLAGLRETLLKHRPVLMLELSDDTRRTLGSPQALAQMLPSGYRVEQIVRPRAWAGVLSRRHAQVEPLVWTDVPTRGGYVNLLLRPAP